MIAKGTSHLDLGPFSINLTIFNNMDHLDLTILKERKITESILYEISGKTFGKETVLTALLLKKLKALSAVSININQRALEDLSVRQNKDTSTCRVHDCTEKKDSSCEQTESNAPSSMIDDDADKRKKYSEVSCCEQLQTSSMVCNTTDEERMSSEDFDDLDHGERT